MNEERSLHFRPARPFRAVAAAVLAAVVAGASAPRPAAPARGGECLVLIDLDAFHCGLCLESLLAFCRAVPAACQETQVRAVLLLRPPSAGVSDADLVRIALKKWEGFRRANGIRIPVLCDGGRAFRPPEKSGASVILLDGPGRAARTLPLPLQPKELADVLRFLGQ